MSEQSKTTVEPIIQPIQPAEALQIRKLSSDNVGRLGWLLCFFGVAGIIGFAFLYDTSVHGPDGSVINFDMEVSKLVGAGISCALFLAGVIALAVSRMEQTLIMITSQKPPMQP